MAGPVMTGLVGSSVPKLTCEFEQRHSKKALQVGLLVDREELSAVLDAVEIGLVHVKRAKLDTSWRTGLHDPVERRCRHRRR